MSTNLPQAIVVPHTHWDREWRYPIWRTRAMLVAMMDRLLGQLDASGDPPCFVLDGQSVMVEDYLEMRPDQRDRVRRLVQAGRLKIGPWYTLPDLYPLDGECLIRNLLRGIRYCRSLGGHLGVAYNSFGWGQTAQLPQIYAGFGFDFLIAAKRVSKQRAPLCEFWWEAPDGSRILTSRLGTDGRALGFFHAYIPARYGVEYMSADYRFRPGVTGQAIHAADSPGRAAADSPGQAAADAARADDDYFRIDRETGYHADQIPRGMQAAWHGMNETASSDYRLILDGSDFTGAQPILTRMIRDANEHFDDKRFELGTLEQYAAELHRRVRDRELPIVRGELRDGPASACSANALAVRIGLKQLNKRAETTLLRRAEPLCCLMAMLAEAYPDAMLDRAWEYLLKSHPHDSIGGVTQDKTADDTKYRLRQAIEIGEVLYDQSVAQLAGRIDLSGQDDTCGSLLLVNPLPYATRGVLEVCVDTPREEDAWSVRLTDTDGRELDVQPVSRQALTWAVHDPETRPWPYRIDRHTLYVDPGEIPAGGYKALSVTPRQRCRRDVEWWPPMRTSRGNDIARRADQLENEYLKVDVQADGTFHLTDKVRGRTLEHIHYFEDTGDVGDYWAYYPPGDNRTLLSRGQPATMWLDENGPLSATIGVQAELAVPTHAEPPFRAPDAESHRVAGTTPLTLCSRFTLRRGSPLLDVRTSVTNRARDHRLRLLIPTDLQTDHADAAGHFHVDRRGIYPPRDERNEFYPEMQTAPMGLFVDVADGQRGLAVISNSLTEYQLLDDDRRTLALTLLRAVRNRICSEARSSGNFPRQHGGQSLETLHYEYALYPHAGDWRGQRHEGIADRAGAGLHRRALHWTVPPSAFQITPSSQDQPLPTLPPAGSLWRIEPGELVLSALKRAEDRSSYIVRVFNPTDRPIDGRITLPVELREAYIVDLNENRQSAATVSDKHSVHLHVTPGQIVTMEAR